MSGNGVGPSALATPTGEGQEPSLDVTFKPTNAQVAMQQQNTGQDMPSLMASPSDQPGAQAQAMPQTDPLDALYEQTHGDKNKQTVDPLDALYEQTHSAAPAQKQEEPGIMDYLNPFKGKDIMNQSDQAYFHSGKADSTATKNYDARQAAILAQNNMTEVPYDVAYKLGTADSDAEKGNLLKTIYPNAQITKNPAIDAFTIHQQDGSILTTNKVGSTTVGDFTKYGSDLGGMGAQAVVDALTMPAVMSGVGTVAGIAVAGAAGGAANRYAKNFLAQQAGIPRSDYDSIASNAILSSVFSLGGKGLLAAVAGKVGPSEAATNLSNIVNNEADKKINSMLDIIDQAKASGKLQTPNEFPNALTKSELIVQGEGTTTAHNLAATAAGNESTMAGNQVWNDAAAARDKSLSDYGMKVIDTYGKREAEGYSYKDIIGKLNNKLNFDGQDIAQYTKKAVQDNPSAPVVLDATEKMFSSQEPNSIASRLGLHFDTDSSRLMLKSSSGEALPATEGAINKVLFTAGFDKESAERVAPIVQTLGKNLLTDAGELSLDQANTIRRDIESAWKVEGSKLKINGSVYGLLSDLKNSFTDDFITTAEKFVDPKISQGYAVAKSSYALSKRVEDTMVGLIGNKDDIFAEDFYKKLFESKNPDVLMHAIVASGNNAEAKQSLFGNYVGNLLDAKNSDIYSVVNKLNKLPVQTKQIIAGSPEGYTEFTNMLKIVGSAANSLSSPTATEEGKQLATKTMGIALGAHGIAQANLITKIGDYLTSNSRVTKELSGINLNRIIDSVPVAKKEGVMTALANLIKIANDKATQNSGLITAGKLAAKNAVYDKVNKK